MGQIARCFYYFFMIVVVIRYKTKATARRALTFIVPIFVNDTIAIAVWTSFHVCASEASRTRPIPFLKRTWRGLVGMSANDPKRTFVSTYHSY